VVCLLAANGGSNCSLTRAMDGRIVRCGIISSCQSAATSETVKRFWSRTHVRSAITSAFTFLPLPQPDTSFHWQITGLVHRAVCLFTSELSLVLTASIPTEGWPGWVGLGGWLHAEIDEGRNILSRQTRNSCEA